MVIKSEQKRKRIMNLVKNDIIDVTITALSNDGSGVGRYDKPDGAVVFVPFTAIGDVLKARVLKVTKSAVYGKIEALITPSPDRVAECDCAVFGSPANGRSFAGKPCGGCDFRHVNDEAELRAKEAFIRDAFTRIGGLNPLFLPPIPSPALTRYRNKAQYPVARGKDGNAVYGYYARNSHAVIPHTDCPLQPVIFTEIADYVIEFVRENKIPVYDELTKNGVLRRICLRRGHDSGEINLTLVAKRKVPEFDRLARGLAEKFPVVKGVVLNINRAETNAVMGEREFALIGESDISDVIAGVEVRVSPRSFYQVNTAAAELLYGLIREFAGNLSGKTVLDLYCGIGAIGLSLFKGKEAPKRLIGVETVAAAVGNAAENAERNGFADKAEFMCMDAGAAASALFARGVKPDVIILDPARKGCDYSTLESFAKLSPKRAVMASCNPATAARDCERLARLGYEATRVRGVDMFPGTKHVECAVELVLNT